MANPIWNEKKQKWILRVYSDGKVIKEFTSSKKGPAGARDCNRRRSEFIGGYAEGNDNTTLYSLRHTFITQLAPLLPESTLKSLVGHSVDMTTYQTYNHITDKQLKLAADIQDKIF